MGRWEPDARGRLAQAALALFAEQGLEQTTVAQIAGRAGLTERTFFRHFADKREVLFHGSESAVDLLVGAVAAAPAGATPIEAVSAALIKLAGMAAAMAGALRERGVAEPAASLTAETGIAVLKVAFVRWTGDPGGPELPPIIRESLARLRQELAG